jgi:hypothetical protein
MAKLHGARDLRGSPRRKSLVENLEYVREHLPRVVRNTNARAVAEDFAWVDKVRVHGQNDFDATVMHLFVHGPTRHDASHQQKRHRELSRSHTRCLNGDIYGGKTPLAKGPWWSSKSCRHGGSGGGQQGRPTGDTRKRSHTTAASLFSRPKELGGAGRHVVGAAHKTVAV